MAAAEYSTATSRFIRKIICSIRQCWAQSEYVLIHKINFRVFKVIGKLDR
jgi:hypothetical protein